MLNFNKLGILFIIIIMSFFINVFYYISWNLTEYWLDDQEPAVAV